MKEAIDNKNPKSTKKSKLFEAQTTFFLEEKGVISIPILTMKFW